jgi:hypothetical protein
MEDAACFQDEITALDYLNHLRQGFAGHTPAIWLVNQDFTSAELAELEERVLQRAPTTRINKVLRAIKSGDENKVLDAIRMVRGIGALTAYLAKFEDSDEGRARGYVHQALSPARN